MSIIESNYCMRAFDRYSGEVFVLDPNRLLSITPDMIRLPTKVLPVRRDSIKDIYSQCC